MLDVAGLGYRYPAAPAPALKDVSFGAARGRILGLLGPNGAGKSTLVAHLAGLLEIQQGSIRVNGLALREARLREARLRDPSRIAVAPQEFAFYPLLTVRENLACFAAANRLHGDAARAAVARCLALGQLEAQAGTRAERLSGGFKRRLNLAIALLAEPDLIVLDEPTVGVDPESRAFVLQTVKGLAAAGAAVIYTSHYMEEIEAIADDVAILHRGRLLRHGTLAALLSDGRAHLDIALAETPPDGLAAHLSRFGAVWADGTRMTLELLPDVSPGAPLAAVEASGATIRESRFGRYSLEQLFTRLTGSE